MQANTSGRAALAPFLSGRRTIPYEQGVIILACVPMVTFNPAQLRRLLICNLDAVAMDLALTGRQALEAAYSYGPVTLPTVRTDLEAHREALVRLLRQVVKPAFYDRLDSDMILMLAAGMTGFLDDETRAIQQVVYNAALVLETLGWTTPNWLAAVTEFSLFARPFAVIESADVLLSVLPASQADDTGPHDTIILRRRIMTDYSPSQCHHIPFPTRPVTV